MLDVLPKQRIFLGVRWHIWIAMMFQVCYHVMGWCYKTISNGPTDYGQQVLWRIPDSMASKI